MTEILYFNKSFFCIHDKSSVIICHQIFRRICKITKSAWQDNLRKTLHFGPFGSWLSSTLVSVHPPALNKDPNSPQCCVMRTPSVLFTVFLRAVKSEYLRVRSEDQEILALRRKTHLNNIQIFSAYNTLYIFHVD